MSYVARRHLEVMWVRQTNVARDGDTQEKRGSSLFPCGPVLSCACMTSKRRLLSLSAQKNDSLSCKKCDTYISLLTMLSLCFAEVLILLLIYGVIEGSILPRKVSLVVSWLISSINDLCKI